MEQTDARRMKSLALEITPNGFARPGQNRALLSRFKDAVEDASLLSGRETDGPFRAALGLMRRMQDALSLDKGPLLPAVDGVPRVVLFARSLVGKGDTPLTREDIMSAVRVFDLTKSLLMEEIWCVPRAIRQALAEAFLDACEKATELERAKIRAEQAISRHRFPRRESDAFFERAMTAAAEREDGEAIARLEEILATRDDAPAQLAARSHGEEALLMLRIENLGQGRQVMSDLDWEEAFPTLSRAEQELMQDPAGIYPDMDDASRAHLRREVADAARYLGMGEVTLIRHAAACARSASDGDSVRQNITWWLGTDEGRSSLAAHLGFRKNPLPRVTPDPGGRLFMWTNAILAGLFFLIFAAFVKFWPAVIAGIPLSWCGARMVLNHVLSRAAKPYFLYRMEKIPDDARCLVVLPVLLTSPARTREAAQELESLGALDESDASYLLLGDFRDGDSETARDDEAILTAARKEIAQLNRAAGREKYFYLHRPRTFFAPDRKWMGRERKRGAIMDLNALLLGKEGSFAAFSKENAAAPALAGGGYRYCLTLDAGTRILPGTVKKLLGTAVHPLNRHRTGNGYSVFQPAVEQAPGSVKNAFARLFGGEGGVNSYPSSASDAWQDLTGQGIYSGKGLYDIRAFDRALSGSLPDGKILSHDLIEGVISRCAPVNDVTVFDGFPGSVSGYWKRLNRWTRGDWQLLPFLFSGKKYGEKQMSLPASGRFLMLDNLIRSLSPASALLLVLFAAWFSLPQVWWAAAAWFLLPGVLSFLFSGKFPGRRALGEFLMTPVTASAQLDAILRTLFRLAFSGRHMLDWVTAADSDGADRAVLRYSRYFGLLLLPGILSAEYVPVTLLFSAAFLLAPEYLTHLENTKSPAEPLLSRRQVALYTALAKDTWKYFDRFVTPATHFLPPDNVQEDPPVGAAKRTSPTNIGLYLVSCAAAHELGFIRMDEFARRADETLGTLEEMEKWRGMPYNWYATDDISPLYPKYVSSVDSGNLAASLLLLSRFLLDAEPEIARRAEKLAHDMDLAALYDERKKLFYIGYDAGASCMSQSHYDLLASESRILSMTAILMKKVSPEHWRRLGRPACRTKHGAMLLSWSGTMFEYLMPSLFLRAPEGTLLRASERAAVEEQIARGKSHSRPWGVSESGYAAFDRALNYQYHAFGLSRLALSGPSREDVVAPYASALAAAVDPAASADNLIKLSEMGLWGEYGPYEALDMAHGEANPVKSWMAHHEGMTLAAACNVLTGDRLANAFQSMPEARAASLLLEEKPATASRLPARPAEHPEAMGKDTPAYPRTPRVNAMADAHILSGGGTLAILNARGIFSAQNRGLHMGKTSEDILSPENGIRVFFDLDGEEIDFFPRAKAYFHPGKAVYELTEPDYSIMLSCAVSPETGSLILESEIENKGTTAIQASIINAAFSPLMTLSESRAHPAFHGLFMECESAGDGAILTRRKPRRDGEGAASLLHESAGGAYLSAETDRAKFSGRLDGHRLTGLTRHPILPCSALARGLSLLPGEKGSVRFSLTVLREGTKETDADRSLSRAAKLGALSERSIARFSGADGHLARLSAGLSAVLSDPHFPERQGEEAPFRREDLWQTGISGDIPILCVYAEGEEGIRSARDAVRAHAYLAMHGVESDLVLIACDRAGYAKPVRNALENLVMLSHFAQSEGKRSGAHILDEDALSEEAKRALTRAAFVVKGAFRDEVRKLLALRLLPARRARVPFPKGEPLREEKLEFLNGYGGVSDGEYVITSLPPAAWVNVLASEHVGAILSERGGGCMWAGSSRFSRLFPFRNDPLREGGGWMLYAENRTAFSPLLPEDMDGMHARHSAGSTKYEGQNGAFSYEITIAPTEEQAEMRLHVVIASKASEAMELTLTLFCDWLAGCDMGDARFLTTWRDENGCYASGAMEGVCYAAVHGGNPGGGRAEFLGTGGILSPDNPQAAGDGGHVLRKTCSIPPEGRAEVEFVIGAERDIPSAKNRAEEIAKGAHPTLQEEREPNLTILTPDKAINALFNHFLPHQVLASRVLGRTGLYQPGGAYGFRDQLQDMLSLIQQDPARVRAHILMASARQFESGDVLHWWHTPSRGVRTRISDDLLFLPYVAAAYIRETGDAGILDENVPYLADVPIPDGQEDLYEAFHETEYKEPLYSHIIRAFRRADRTGMHGLSLMGGGDWNDGMNRVGDGGKGESVWLSEFIAKTAADFAEFARTEDDKSYLTDLSRRMKGAVEAFGWDGDRYLRAFTDEGKPIGGRGAAECAIDALSQAWAVFAELDPARCTAALDTAWRELVDEELGVVRLLAPAFTGIEDPGYIASYPPGVRENGAQYTHGAVWLLMSYIKQGDHERAHRLLRMLLPLNHALTKEDTTRYRVEPYVMAGDVYTCPGHEGMGGWTWYTGAAGWMMRAILSLMGYERRSDRVRISPMLGEWEEASLTVRYGSTRYTLISRKGTPGQVEWATLTDDGGEHTIFFLPR